MGLLDRLPALLSYRSVLARNVFPRPALRTSSSSALRSIEVPTTRVAEPQDSFPTIKQCPSPTFQCAEMPTDLDIDYKKNIRATMPPYTRHVVIRTNQNDWASKIEDEGIGHGQEKRVNLARELKELIGPKGKYYDPRTSILISNSSFPSQGRTEGRDVLLYPEGYSINNVGETPESLHAFIEQALISSTGKPADVAQNVPHSVRKPTVLICGHNTRDRRCGVLGSLLRDEFLAQSRRYATTDQESVASIPPATEDLLPNSGLVGREGHTDTVYHAEDVTNLPFSVGLVSHVGGHAWAGNVIVYVPPDYRLVSGMISPLAGKGVWYGRVQPKHVDGIVEETIQRGRVIEELLRGVHTGKDIG